MLWEVEIHQRTGDRETERAREEYDLLTHTRRGTTLVRRFARGFLLEGDLDQARLERLLDELLVDRVTEYSLAGPLNHLAGRDAARGADPFRASDQDGERIVTVLLKPGVMDPVAQSVAEEAHDLGVPVESVGTFRRYFLDPAALADADREVLFRKVLANEAIEQVVEGPLSLDHLGVGTPYAFRLVTVPLRRLDDAGLERLSREGQLSLSLAEMRTIQEHFRALDRDPTDAELETLAQTWSEHCSHKTLKGQIDFEVRKGDCPLEERGTVPYSDFDGRRIDNLLRETIFGATQEIRRRLGADDWCVSVFEDNAGIVRFDEQFNVCFKVETHNHPSAIEPYGGANTGLGGVIRDPLGTGLGARPVCNTDVFCFAPPDTPPEALPSGVLHPQKVIRGVVAGVRDYGNRIGIPTVNGAVCFDARYLANPLVFCGTVGLIPVDRCRKQPEAGDRIVVIGGRTGRDGIHGATFSSVELSAESEKVSGGAVQIGNAITEKKLLDVLLEARDRGLYHAVTDCGAGGLSSAVGEMGERLGAVVELEKVPLKYEGLSYTEIWISEAQERMVLAVPPGKWPILKALCDSEHVEATPIGAFEMSGRLRLLYEGNLVADLDMAFLHHGRPPVVRRATWQPIAFGEPHVTDALRSHAPGSDGLEPPEPGSHTDDLLRLLSSYDVCSKEWIVRQYDHEVQGGTVIKPLVGVREDGPGDAAVVTPVLGSPVGLAVGCGINPHYGDLDPYWMAAAVIDEAVRNVVAVGADPGRVALLDNFCWGNTDRPEVLGSLVRAAEACRDVALAYAMPFISGKDSLNNEYHAGVRKGDGPLAERGTVPVSDAGVRKGDGPLAERGTVPVSDAGVRHLVIPPTLLISALGRVPDVRQCVTMDLKEPGSELFLVGVTRNELGGSQYYLRKGIAGGKPPRVDLRLAPLLFHRLHDAIRRGLIRACHDLSDGGLAVAVAEMAFAGGVGADVTTLPGSTGQEPDEVLLFSESATRFLLEVKPEKVAALRDCFGQDVPLTRVGQTTSEARLRVAGTSGEWIIWTALADLKEAWQRPLRW